MPLYASRLRQNGQGCYSGKYKSGRVYYRYYDLDGARVYHGLFRFRSVLYDQLYGRTVDHVTGCYVDGKRSGHWTLDRMSRHIKSKLVVEYENDKHNGKYRYHSTSGKDSFDYGYGYSKLEFLYVSNRIVGDVAAQLGNNMITGRYDNEGLPDGEWMSESMLKDFTTTEREVWEHGTCKSSYTYDESTGIRKDTTAHLPSLVTNFVNHHCSRLERLVDVVSDTRKSK